MRTVNTNEYSVSEVTFLESLKDFQIPEFVLGCVVAAMITAFGYLFISVPDVEWEKPPYELSYDLNAVQLKEYISWHYRSDKYLTYQDHVRIKEAERLLSLKTDDKC